MERAPISTIPGSSCGIPSSITGSLSNLSQSWGSASSSPMSNGCFELSSPVPRPNKPPIADDWSNYRSIITDLWLDQNMILPELRKFMANQYGFYATQKMFKDRFSRWKLRKNYSQSDIENFLAALRANIVDPEDATLLGKPVLWSRIERRVSEPKRPSIAFDDDGDVIIAGTPSTARLKKRPRSRSDPVLLKITAQYAKTPRSLIPTTSWYRGGLLFKLVSAYLEERLFSVTSVHYFGFINLWMPQTPKLLVAGEYDGTSPHHPADLNQNYTRGRTLMKNGRMPAAFASLSKAFDMLADLFQNHHPALTSCLLDSFVESVMVSNPGTKGLVMDFATDYALKFHGPNHPITAMCRFLSEEHENESDIEHAMYFWQKYCQLFTETFGQDHHISIFINQKFLEKLMQLQCYTEALTHIQETLDPVFAQMMTGQRCDTGLEAAFMWYLRRRAHLLRCLGHIDEAEKMVQVSLCIMKQLVRDDRRCLAGNPIIEEAFRNIDEIARLIEANIRLESTISYHKTSTDSHEAARYLSANVKIDHVMDLRTFAIELCIKVRGQWDGKTISMISDQEQRLLDFNLGDRALNLRMRFPEIFTQMEWDEDISIGHHSPCPNCGNGPDTQIFCEMHRVSENESVTDRIQKDIILERLESLP